MANGDKTYIGPISVNGTSPDASGNIEAVGELTPHTMGFHTDYPSEISIAELSHVEGLESNLQEQINSKFELGVGGGAVQISASSIVLVNTSKKMQEISITSPNQAVILPDATTMNRGGCLFVIKNCGVFSFFVLNAGFMQVGEMVQPGKSVFLYLVENSNYKGSWFLTSNDFEELSSLLPMGLIVPFNSTSIPSGWSRFTLADNRLIVGAGNTYSVGQVGGNNGGNFGISATMSTSGSHLGSPVTNGWGEGYSTSNGTHDYYQNYSSGDHSHTISNINLGSPSKSQFVLIKSIFNQRNFPINAIVLSKQSLNNIGLINIPGTNKCLSSGNAIVNNTITGTYDATTTNGLHKHTDVGTTWGSGAYGGTLYYPINSGDHNHPGNSLTSISENYKRMLMSLWTNSLSTFLVSSNMIAMYESLTPPNGWVLCDGNNGTPNLKDNFIEIVNTGSESVISTGDNTISYSINTTITGENPHDHLNINNVSDRHDDPLTLYHTTDSWSHSHIVNFASSISMIPSYYALSFIMKK